MKRKTSKVTALFFCSLIFLVLVACQSNPTFDGNQDLNLSDSMLSTQALSVGQQTLLFHPEATGTDPVEKLFGYSSAIEGSIAVIGSRTFSEKVNIFSKNNNEWELQQQIVGSDQSFGKAVAIKNGVIYVGQKDSCLVPPLLDSCVFGYTFNGVTWEKEFTIQETGSIATDIDLGNFGEILAVSDSMLFVGEFNSDKIVWLTLNGIELGRMETNIGGHFDFAADGNTLVVGRTFNSNIVDIYDTSSGSPQLIQQLAGPENSFGSSVDISGDMLLIGATGDNNGNGAAYLYEFINGVWELSKPHPSTDYFYGSDGNSNSGFGINGAISGENLIIGDHTINDSTTSGGKIYIFSKSGNNNQWNYNSPKVVTYSGNNGSQFGFRLSVDGDLILTSSERFNPDSNSTLQGGGVIIELWDCNSSNNQNAVTELDPNLAAIISAQTGNSPVTCSDLESLTTIVAPNEGIQHLEGLQYAINLSQVNLRGNNISDLTPLASATNLINLYLQDNVYVDGNGESHYISDLTPLANATNLKKLWLRGSNISDLTPLTNMANLWDLDLRQNQGVVTDITPLANKNMRNLYIHYGDLDDLTPLSNMSKLIALDLVQSDISDADIDTLFSGSTNFPKLKNLNLYNQFPANPNLNTISDLSEIGTIGKLETLFIYGNNIVDVTPLSQLKNTLTILFLSSNDIVDVEPLSDLKNLIQLDLADNFIYYIDSFENELDDLEYLRIFKNHISEIETALTGKNNLSYVSIFDNCIVDIAEVAFIDSLVNNPNITVPGDPYFQPCNNQVPPGGPPPPPQ